MTDAMRACPCETGIAPPLAAGARSNEMSVKHAVEIAMTEMMMIRRCRRSDWALLMLAS